MVDANPPIRRQIKRQRAPPLHSGLKLYEIDVYSTGPFARSLARSLAPLTHSLAPHCSLCSRAPLRSFAHSLASELMGKRFMSMNLMRRFHTISTHCASVHRSVRNAISQTRARLIFCRVTVFLGVYRRVCPFVHRSIRRSVRRSVASFHFRRPVSRGQYRAASITWPVLALVTLLLPIA